MLKQLGVARPYSVPCVCGAAGTTGASSRTASAATSQRPASVGVFFVSNDGRLGLVVETTIGDTWFVDPPADVHGVRGASTAGRGRDVHRRSRQGQCVPSHVKLHAARGPGMLPSPPLARVSRLRGDGRHHAAAGGLADGVGVERATVPVAREGRLAGERAAVRGPVAGPSRRRASVRRGAPQVDNVIVISPDAATATAPYVRWTGQYSSATPPLGRPWRTRRATSSASGGQAHAGRPDSAARKCGGCAPPFWSSPALAGPLRCRLRACSAHHAGVLVCRRGALSMLGACYAFGRKSPARYRIWPAAGRELFWVASALPLLRVAARRAWDTAA